MAVASLRAHLIEELTDLLDAETQLTQALPKMAAAATTKPLKTAFQKHLQETRGHITRLNQALQQLGERPRRKTCEGMEGLLSEGEEVMNKAPEGALRDAVMITAAQKVEHYEMASYGTARTYAQVLGESSVARLLGQTLKEEKAADSKLSAIAEDSVNEEAAEAWQSQSQEAEEAGPLLRSATWLGGAVGTASRQLGRGARRAAASMGIANDRRPRQQKRTGAATRRRRKAGSRVKHR
jgi:ferritin-like metal-binding protein YciE